MPRRIAPKQKIVTRHDLLNLVADYHNPAFSAVMVAKRNGISIAILTRRLLEAEVQGIPITYRRGTMTNFTSPEVVERLYEDLRENILPSVTIAEKHGVCLPTLRNLERVGIAKGLLQRREELTLQRDIHNKTNKFRAWVSQKLKDNWSPSTLARIAGVTRERVRQWGKLDNAGYDSKYFRKNAAGATCPHCQGNLTAEYLIAEAKQLFTENPNGTL